MSVRDDLVLIGWLAELAPESAAAAGAGARATAAVRGVYRDAAQLDDALAKCLRRAAATAVLQLPEAVDPVEGQRAVMADRAGFSALLDREEPAVVAVARRLDAIGPTRGVGARLAPRVLDAFRVQARDLFPREDMGGIALAVEVVQAGLTTMDAHARLRAERELAGLHARAGDARGVAEHGGPGDGAAALVEADTLAGGGDLDGARARLGVARQRFEQRGDLPGIAAVLRRESALVDPEERPPALRRAVQLARDGGDPIGEAEGLEELSRAYAEAGRVGPAVAALGAVARLARARVDAAGEARALQLAGRLLCEAPPGEDDPGRGLVILLFAADLAASVDPVVADLVRRYVTGFQYTLSDARFAQIEAIFDREREEVVEETFRDLTLRFREELP